VLDEEEEDSGSNERSDRSGRGWLAKFSTLKVAPQRGVRPATGQTEVGAHKGTEDRLISMHWPVRTVGEVAKKRLEWYHKLSE